MMRSCVDEDERLAAFLKVVAKIPQTWTCIRCKREFPNHPGGEVSYAVETIFKDGRQQAIGEICETCYKK